MRWLVIFLLSACAWDFGLGEKCVPCEDDEDCESRACAEARDKSTGELVRACVPSRFHPDAGRFKDLTLVCKTIE